METKSKQDSWSSEAQAAVVWRARNVTPAGGCSGGLASAAFLDRVPVGGWVFVLAGLGAIAPAVLTVGYQSLRAALANPVDALRSG